MIRNHRASPLISSRQTLAAVRTASGENLAATLGAEAGAEAVAALADKLGGLISTFHGSFSAVTASAHTNGVRVPIELNGIAPSPQQQKRAPAIAMGASRPRGRRQIRRCLWAMPAGKSIRSLDERGECEGFVTLPGRGVSSALPATSLSALPSSSAPPRPDPPARGGGDSVPSSPRARRHRSPSRIRADPWSPAPGGGRARAG